MDSVTIIRVVSGILFLAVLAVGIAYIAYLSGILSKCAASSRTMQPGMVWLLLVPLFNFIWCFLVEGSSVQQLATKFVAADFYSMDDAYEATVTDMPFYALSISVDGEKKEVTDYVGRGVGMPEVIRKLENDVDALAQTRRWVQVHGNKASLRKACMVQH